MHLVFKPHIVAKLWDKHGVVPEEVGEALQDPKRITVRTGSASKDRRYRIIGKTYGGRILRVILEFSYTEVTVVTAFDAPESDVRRYRKGT